MKAITFDVGGTLIAPHPSVGAVYAAVARRRGLRLEAAEVDRRFRAAFDERPRPFAVSRDGARRNWRTVVGATLEGLVPPPALDDLFDDLWEEFARPRAWRIAEGAAEALARFRRSGWRLGVISNWDDRLPRLLAALGLAANLDAIVVSAEVGCEKPDRRIFEAAVRRLGVPADEILHVGNDPREDIEGARAAGMDAVLLDASSGGRLDIAAVVDLVYGGSPSRERPTAPG